jgi:SAM-dependent methyltransferase
VAISRLGFVRDLLANDPRARGKVLDAGTGGGYMTAVLAGFRPAELRSVSVDEASFAASRSLLPSGLADRIRFTQGDLCDPGLLAGETYDLIAGDYLLAAVAGHRPFREIDLLKSLVGRLAPGGLLLLTGLEPLATCRTAEEEAVRRLLRWRTALVYLGGEEAYREVPGWWVAERLREAGCWEKAASGVGPDQPPDPSPAISVEDPVYTPGLEWSMAQLRLLAEDAARRAENIGELRLAAFVRSHLGRLCRRAARRPGFDGGAGRVTWSQDWIVRATRSGA